MNNEALLCAKVHELFRTTTQMRFPYNDRLLPRNGIYVLFETGELGHGTSRIVRIGTHRGQDQLKPRLTQHFVQENKDRSIFRKNIGRAILAKAGDPFLKQWNLDLTTGGAKALYADKIDWAKQRQIEHKVTSYIQANFSFAAFQIDHMEERLSMESMLIGTISLCDLCHPSGTWLGRFSPIQKIRDSGLWLVNELYKTPLTESAFDRLKRLASCSNPAF
jgi:hypothetical protein